MRCCSCSGSGVGCHRAWPVAPAGPPPLPQSHTTALALATAPATPMTSSACLPCATPSPSPVSPTHPLAQPTAGLPSSPAPPRHLQRRDERGRQAVVGVAQPQLPVLVSAKGVEQPVVRDHQRVRVAARHGRHLAGPGRAGPGGRQRAGKAVGGERTRGRRKQAGGCVGCSTGLTSVGGGGMRTRHASAAAGMRAQRVGGFVVFCGRGGVGASVFQGGQRSMAPEDVGMPATNQPSRWGRGFGPPNPTAPHTPLEPHRSRLLIQILLLPMRIRIRSAVQLPPPPSAAGPSRFARAYLAALG